MEQILAALAPDERVTAAFELVQALERIMSDTGRRGRRGFRQYERIICGVARHRRGYQARLLDPVSGTGTVTLFATVG
jgi:hypothetical protein